MLDIFSIFEAWGAILQGRARQLGQPSRQPCGDQLQAAQAMYQPAQRHQPFAGHVPGSQGAEARQPVTQPGYWAGAPPQQAYHPAGHQRKTAYVAPAEPSAHAARPARRLKTGLAGLAPSTEARQASEQRRRRRWR